MTLSSNKFCNYGTGTGMSLCAPDDAAINCTAFHQRATWFTMLNQLNLAELSRLWKQHHVSTVSTRCYNVLCQQWNVPLHQGIPTNNQLRTWFSLYKFHVRLSNDFLNSHNHNGLPRVERTKTAGGQDNVAQDWYIEATKTSSKKTVLPFVSHAQQSDLARSTLKCSSKTPKPNT